MGASTVTLSCQSVVNPADTACFLTYGNCQTQQWTVVPDSHRITKPYRIRNIHLMAVKKLQQSIWTAAAVFLHTKYTHQPQIRGRVVNTHSSRSSDLRIVSICTAFSGFPNDRLSPCAEPPRIQRRYRPGFSPDSLFSCDAVTTSAGTQMEYLAYN